ncbi:hypothetical protein ACN47E_008784 [Coniothyrium glycines]
MSSVIIPAMVTATGPKFQTLPNEILLMIFKYVFVISDSLNEHVLRVLVLHGRFPKWLAMSKNISGLVREAFFTNNLFKFTDKHYIYRSESWGSDELPLLPQPQFRHLFRRIQIKIILVDYYWADAPDYDKATKTGDKHILTPITNVDQLYQYCAGARKLRDLTHATTGFGRLDVLDLTIEPHFDFYDDVTFATYKAAGLSVRAGQVNIEIVPQSTRDPCYMWADRLKDTIAVD